MRWHNERRSQNVEDRRGAMPSRLALGGGGAIIVLLIAMLFGVDPRTLLRQAELSTQAPPTTQVRNPAEDELAEFVSVVRARRNTTSSPFGSSCKPTFSPVCGRITRKR